MPRVDMLLSSLIDTVSDIERTFLTNILLEEPQVDFDTSQNI